MMSRANVATVVVLAVLVVVVVGVGVPCPLHAATGLLCPGCGTTRAIRAALVGDLDEAFAHNPLTVSLVAVGVALGVVRVCVGRPLLRPALLALLVVVVFAAAVWFTIARNGGGG